MQDLGLEQQLLAPRTRLIDQDRGIHALFGHAAIQMDLTVARTLELLVDHLIHAAAGVDQGGADDGQ